jgi:hypothetical protein
VLTKVAKPKEVKELTKIAHNVHHPHRQAALDELGTMVGKGRFVGIVMGK